MFINSHFEISQKLVAEKSAGLSCLGRMAISQNTGTPSLPQIE